jgi:oligopeptide/dipeptide ABC transporter ATP-binding protein
MTLLTVENLRLTFPGPAGTPIHPVDGVSLGVRRGEVLALVGESGCGKSLTCLALLRLVPPPGTIAPGSVIRLGETDVLALDAEGLRALRGGRIGMVFQDPGASLDPVFTAGAHVVEALRAQLPLGRDAARRRALQLLQEVGVSEDKFEAYPHQLSGGLRQRVMIAVALAGEAELLVADEPTSALDPTVQAQIIELLDALRRRRELTVLLVTHDLALVAGYADRVAVMYAGQIVETGPTAAFYGAPGHPYSQGLLAATPHLDAATRVMQPIPGTVPVPSAWPTGCRFHPRCPRVLPRCAGESPPWFALGDDRRCRCWLHAPEGR